MDYDYPDGQKLTVSGGVAGTDGIMHTGIGPFDIQSGTVMGYGKVAYSNKALRASFFTNILHGDADNLLARNPLNFHPLRNDRTTAISSDDLLKFIRATGHEPIVARLPERAA